MKKNKIFSYTEKEWKELAKEKDYETRMRIIGILILGINFLIEKYYGNNVVSHTIFYLVMLAYFPYYSIKLKIKAMERDEKRRKIYLASNVEKRKSLLKKSILLIVVIIFYFNFFSNNLFLNIVRISQIRKKVYNTKVFYFKDRSVKDTELLKNWILEETRFEKLLLDGKIGEIDDLQKAEVILKNQDGDEITVVSIGDYVEKDKKDYPTVFFTAIVIKGNFVCNLKPDILLGKLKDKDYNFYTILGK